MTYVVLNGVTGLVKLVTRGKLVPADYEEREFWTCMIPPPSLDLKSKHSILIYFVP